MLTINTAAGLERLNRVLPLADRQAALAAPLRALHREILHGFVKTGAPPARERLAGIPGIADVGAALQQLAADDLVVLAADGITITGAYPFTVEERGHRVTMHGNTVHAMCALDALSVAPMFNAATHIESACHASGDPVAIDLRGAEIVSARPAAPMVGIRWQSTSGCAAQSLCLEMVFLRDPDTAATWRQQDPEHITLYALPEAVAFGAAFFRPLVEPA